MKVHFCRIPSEYYRIYGDYYMLGLYVFTFGVVASAIGIGELLMPGKAFLLWKKWAGNRFFFLHGLMLISAGFPLTFYKGVFSTAIFAVGLIIVLTGPFILLYPEKVRDMFETMAAEMPDQGIQRIVIFEGVIRTMAGMLFISTKFMG
ncbi:MAG TPA: hypothetical protein PLI62_05000 [Spirochaetota bacterium]|nr:hypothetical protein [Spirochaetota bacterium]